MNIKSKLVGGALSLAMVAVLSTAVLETGYGAETVDTPRAAPRGFRGGMDGPGPAGLRIALRQLELTDAQKQEVQSILSAAREQARTQRASAPLDLTTLGNPGDPNYAAAIEAAKARAVARIEQMSEVQKRLYALLTPAQQARLPQILSDLQQKRDQHRRAG